MSLDREALRAFELHGWTRAAARYPSTFGRVTASFVEALLDAAEVAAALMRAGFDGIEIRRERRRWVFLSPAELVLSFRAGTVRTGALIAAQPERALPAIEAEIARLALPYRDRGSYRVPIVALLAKAGKP